MIHDTSQDIDHRNQLLYDLDLRFPPLSRTVSEISALLSNKNEAPSTERLIEIVQMDPVVVSSVLRRINSAYYGLQRHFDDISKAVVMIGFLEVSNIVLTSGYVGVRKSMKSKEQAGVLEDILRMSVGAGFFMRLLASNQNAAFASTAFTTGLLHSVGRLVLLYNNPADYVEMWHANEAGFAPSPEMEQDYLGIDHTMLGGIAASHWNLPDPIGPLIESYRTPGHIEERTLRAMGLTLAVSVSISEQLCAHRQRLIDEGVDLNASLPGLSFDYPETLALLARTSGQPASDLEQLIAANQTGGFAYIESMTQL